MNEKSIAVWAERVALTALFLLPFIALVVTPSLFFPFITGKNFAFRILVEVLFAGWAVRALRDRSWRPRPTWVLGVMGILTAWMALANAFSAQPIVSFWSNFERMEGWVTLFHLALYAVAAAGVLGKLDLGKKLLQTHIGAGMLVSLYTFLQYAGVARASRNIERAEATLGNAAYLAVYMLFNIFFALALLLEARRNKTAQWFYGIAIALQTITLFLAATRGTMLGLAGGVLLATLLIAFCERESRLLRNAAVGVIAGIVILVGAFFALKDTALVQDTTSLRRLATISLDDPTTRIRLIVWGMAWEGVKERPIVGWGQEGFIQIFNKYYDPELTRYGAEEWYDRAHNVFFDWATTGGIPALLLYLGLFGVVLVSLWRPTGPFSIRERAVYTGLLAGYFVHNIFVFDNVTSYLLFGTFLAYTHARSTGNFTPAPSHTPAPSPLPAYGVAALLLASLYVFTVPGYRAASASVEGLRAQSDPARAQELFAKGLQLTHFADPEIMMQVVGMARGVFDGNASGETKNTFIAFARETASSTLASFPLDARVWLFYGTFLSQIGAYDEAKYYLDYAQGLSPAKQSVMLVRAVNERGRGNSDEAIAIAKEAYELEPAFDGARNAYVSLLLNIGREEGNTEFINEAVAVMKKTFEGDSSNDVSRRAYAITLIRVGKSAEAEEIIAERYGTPLVQGFDFVNAYASVEEYAKVAELLEMEVAANPQNLQAYVSLAATYYTLWRIDDAVHTIERGIAANPAFTDEGESWIKRIRAGTLPRG